MPLPRLHGEFNVVMDPETKFLDSGKTMVKLRVVAKTRKKVDGSWIDGDSSFFNVVVWDPFAANLIEAGASKGDTVFVSGKIRERQFEKDGEKRSSVEISVGDQDDSIGLSSRWPRRAKSMDNAQANIASAKAALGASDDWGQDVAPF
jgi:single-strand DNA-binding protein